MRYAIPVVAALAALATPAVAAETIASLLAQEFTVVGGIQSNIGVGVLLQKKEKLFLCFASETPASPTIATRYCKPVQ
jgi:hypothetical protein